MSAHQARLLETLLPELSLVPERSRDPRSYFSGAVGDAWLEIGFGGGEHLIWQSEAHPDIGMIGAEPYVSGVAKLLAKIARSSGSLRSCSNIRLYMEDARDIIETLPDASLSRVFILFPDPWPKTRHHKRRFIQVEMLDALARIMKPSAEIRFATDDKGYLVWVLERFAAHRSFEWLADAAPNWRKRPHDWPQTRYEAKAIKQGRVCSYLRFVRA